MPIKDIQTPGARRPPGFWWQGAAILLPVAALAAFGLVSLIKDRSLVEGEARRRAQEVANGLAPAAARSLMNVFLELELAQHLRHGNPKARIHEWPEGEQANNPGSQQAARESARFLAEWREKNPDFASGPVVLARAMLGDDGRGVVPPEIDASALPPDWLAGLAPSARKALDFAREKIQNKAGEKEIGGALGALDGAGVPEEARFNMETFAMLSRWGEDRPPDWVAQLWRRVQRYSNYRTEAGLPLQSVALAMALRMAEKTGPEEMLHRWVADELFFHPSLLTASILQNYDTLAVSSPLAAKLRPLLAEMRELWQAENRLRDLLPDLRATGALAGTNTVTNVWFGAGENRWLAIVSPTFTMQPRKLDGKQVQQVTGHYMEVRLFPKSAVALAVRRALSDPAAPAIPGYADATVLLEGETFSVTGSGARSHPRSDTPLFARTDTVLSQQAIGMMEPVADGSVRHLKKEESEVYPSHPALSITLALERPELLYAGHRRRVWWFGGLIVTAAGVAFLGFAQARRAYMRQFRLVEMQGNFVSSVSHELRAPIASVRLLAESLDRGNVTNEGRRTEYFRLIVQECRRLSARIENVLDFSRIDRRRQEYDFEPTDLSELARQTVKVMEPYAAERRVNIRLVAPVEPVSAEADGKALQQALVNLIDNAVKHSPLDEEVEVGLAAPDVRQVTLWVKDRGPGIPPAEQTRIFEPFHRLGTELRRETQGIGIGLSIVRHVVAAHGGRVTVDSEPGKGSRFTIELPASRNGSAPGEGER
ncbi:MAG TPA: HAMP domain-containing sensor histidine kinase [Verrucomicrobiae bacterium]|nr:HAMP domain-containing sensor histidine kinase [Verrucomicrobiae bacterium]